MNSNVARFAARSVPVLNFSRSPDRQGMIIPPECHCTFDPKVWVFFDSDERNPVGYASLSRKGNVLVADMKLVSSWVPAERALEAIQKLVPSTAFWITDAHENIVTAIRIHSLTLSVGNADKSILPLGDRLTLDGGKDGGH